jgi:DNA-binding NarL/FixJ family response regulator
MAENFPFGVRSEKSESVLGESASETRPVAGFFAIGRTKDFGDTGTIDLGSQDALCLIIDPVTCSTHAEIILAYKMRGTKIVILGNRAQLSRMTNEDVASADVILADDIPAEMLMQSLRRVCSGERISPRDLIPSIPAGAATPQSYSTGRERELSASEREVLSGMVQGHSDKDIAWNLGITEAAVKIHLKSLMRKINVQNRTEAVVWALSRQPHEDSPGRGFV